MELTVVDNVEESRFEARDGERRLGLIAYQLEGDEIALIHTEVEPELEGHGVGGRLVQGALDQIRETGRSVLPYCPFVRAWIARHPDYADLVPEVRRVAFGL